MFLDKLEGADIYDPKNVFISNFKIFEALNMTEVFKDLLIVEIRSVHRLLMEAFNYWSCYFFYFR